MQARQAGGKGALSAERRLRRESAAELAEILDDKLFKALGEPVRVEILRLLIIEARADVGTIAAQLPQDGSVVSRHLAILRDAGVVRSEKLGRHVVFEIDGPGVINRLARILDRFRGIVPLCCPWRLQDLDDEAIPTRAKRRKQNGSQKKA